MGAALSDSSVNIVASLLAYVTVQGVHRRFCSIIVPSIGTSIEAFRRISARLQFHVSGASRPRLASSASAGNSSCSLRAMLKNPL